MARGGERNLAQSGLARIRRRGCHSHDFNSRLLDLFDSGIWEEEEEKERTEHITATRQAVVAGCNITCKVGNGADGNREKFTKVWEILLYGMITCIHRRYNKFMYYAAV